MSDQNTLLLEALKRFARNLTGTYDVVDVLYELSESAVAVLGASAAGVALADDEGRLAFVTATGEAAVQQEYIQQKHQEGPCHDAFTRAETVAVSRIGDHRQWPVYAESASANGIAAVAGIPMLLDGLPIGVLDVYEREPRRWEDADLDQASILAAVATAYLSHASEMERMRRVNERLEEALESRIIIEQAKGVLAGERELSMDAAFDALRRHARNSNATLRAVAEAVVKLGLRP